MKKLVIIPGGFHPFHAGHKALYDAARDAFPSADVYVAATADTSTRPFPFEVKQKLARIAGIDGHRFIQVKSPFQAKEITQHYDPNDTVLIFARSEKDRETQPQAGAIKRDGTPGYLQPYKRNGLEPMSKHGYMVYLPTVQFGPGMTSATEIRAKWPAMEPEQKIRLVNQLYPDTVQKTKLAGVIVQMLDAVIGGEQKTDEGIGKTLAGAALAGALALGQPAQAQTVPPGNTLGQPAKAQIVPPGKNVKPLKDISDDEIIKWLTGNTSGKPDQSKQTQSGQGTSERKTDEGIGKTLAGAALAGALAAGQPAVAQTAPQGNTQATVIIDGETKVIDMGRMDIRQAARMLEKHLEANDLRNWKATITDGRQRVNIDSVDRNIGMQNRADEATLINDPQAGHQIRPAGGMGTWTEDSLRKNLSEKFAQMLMLLKTGQYDKIHDVLKQGSWVDNMVRALAEYQAFQAKQGQKSLAQGAEIDMTDYVDEKRAGQ